MLVVSLWITICLRRSRKEQIWETQSFHAVRERVVFRGQFIPDKILPQRAFVLQCNCENFSGSQLAKKEHFASVVSIAGGYNI